MFIEINVICRLTNLFEETPVNEEVKMAITVATKNFEFTHFERKITYAIRSSAIGEDCEDYSAAGVNATYLGISDLNEIVKCVAKCWASLFSYRSVEYRFETIYYLSKSDMEYTFFSIT